MKPILFSTEMVQAILAGRKTQTRRVVKAPVLSNAKTPDSISIDGNKFVFRWNGPETIGGFDIEPPYNVGDVLWVRETWGDYGGQTSHYIYRADYPLSAKGYWHEKEHINWCDFPKWNSPVTMPREAARLFLRVKDVRVEKVQDIRCTDALSEGVKPDFTEYEGRLEHPVIALANAISAQSSALVAFKKHWNARNAKRGYGWGSNPLVWVIEFEKCNPE